MSIQRRTTGISQIYFDSTSNYSYISIGYLIRCMGHGLKIAYVDTKKNSSKIINVIENLSLSNKFKKELPKLHIETFTFTQKDKISRGIIPLVEFHTINQSLFWKELKKFDIIIFDNILFEHFTKTQLISFIRNKNNDTEIILTTSDISDFEELAPELDAAYKISQKKTSSLLSNKNIVSLTGDGNGKSVYGFGYLFEQFIKKQDVKLVYFDKGDNFYKEMEIFKALKIWKKENSYLYGNFDFVQTGVPRFDGPSSRLENSDSDKKEAKEALMLLKTSLKKQTPVVADQISRVINSNLLTIKEVLDVLNTVENELIVSGEKMPKEILSISNKKIEIENIKSPKIPGRMKGIDF